MEYDLRRASVSPAMLLVLLAPMLTNRVDAPAPLFRPSASVVWASTGGTRPSSIFQRYPDPEATAFTLITDGMVMASEITALSSHAHKTSHLPTILGIARGSGNSKISESNVSVLFSHFTAARTAILVTIQTTEQGYPPVVRVIRAKGDWAADFSHLPDVTDDRYL